jgi:PAS domain S-box-containing protein
MDQRTRPDAGSLLMMKRPSSRPAWRRYAVALASVLLAWAAREALTPAIGPTRLPFTAFQVAVAWTALYGGLGPAVLCIALSGLVSTWFFLPPFGELSLDEPVAFLAFPVSAGLIVAGVQLMHRARRELVRSSEVLATTLSSIGDGVVVTDPAGRVTFLNAEAERLTGWNGADARGRALTDVFRIVNEESRATVDNPVQKVLRQGNVVGLANHTVLIAKDGTETPIDDSAAPVRRLGGPIEGIVLVFRDVREQHLANAARVRLAAIVDSSGDAIVSKDIHGKVLTWNAAAERLFGYRADEIVGRPITTLIPPEHQGEELAILAALREGRPAELIETTRLTKDGRRIPVSVRVSPLRDADGEVTGASKIIRDLSDLVAGRDALAEEKELLTTTLASIGDGVIAADSEARVTFLNPVAEELTGWSRDDAVGQPLSEVFRIVNETTRAEVENPALRAMREGMIVGLANHTVLLSRTGEERAIDDSGAPIRTASGLVVGSILVFRDVTERRRSELGLQYAEERSRSVIDHVLDGIIAIEESGRIESFNHAAEELFGYAASEVIGRNIRMLMPEPYRGEHDEYLRNYITTGRAKVIGIGREVEGLRKDGSTFPLELGVSEFHVGEQRFFSGIVRDLTERKRHEAALRAGEARLLAILEQLPVAVGVLDECGNWTVSNPAMREFVPATISSRDPARAARWHALDERGRPLLPDQWPSARALRGEPVVPGVELEYEKPDGTLVHTVVSSTPLRDEVGKVTGAIAVVQDVDRLKRAEQALRETDQHKNEFIATLAHELRNPLAPIKNSIALLQLEGPPDKPLVAARGIIERQVQQISRLLDDLLDVNRLGRQKLDLRKEYVALDAVVALAMETARPTIEAKRHRISTDVPKDVVLDADPVRLAQVFANLLNNAAKYMDESGRISVKATRERDDIVVSVKDTGIGIAPESLLGLFEMFSQVPLASERSQGGAGIGLSLAKGLVELHGGTISARSEGIGKGSEFLVRLPIAVGAAMPADASSACLERMPGVMRRILIADDMRDNADTLAMLLRALGHDVHAAYGGTEALAAAERFRPEVALLDIGMPGMSGYDVCRRIREQEWGKAMYLIAQTGWGQAEDRRRAEQAGFDRHMLKPLDCAALVAVLSNLPSSPPQ